MQNYSFSVTCAITICCEYLWACGVGGLPLRRYSLRVRAEYSRVPSVIFYTSATSWRIERCRPARDTSNAGVANAECSVCAPRIYVRLLRQLRDASASRSLSSFSRHRISVAIRMAGRGNVITGARGHVPSPPSLSFSCNFMQVSSPFLTKITLFSIFYYYLLHISKIITTFALTFNLLSPTQH